MNVTGQIRVATMSGEIKYVGDVGPRGAEGPIGATGVGIANIELISTEGKTKTYRMTFTNNTYFDYKVEDGVDSEGTSYDDTEIRNLISEKVDKITGKGLSTNDYTSIEKEKLANLPTNPLTSELDPTVPAHVKNITESNIANWNDKQDKLTAGMNITIIDNVISATGGESTGGTTDYTALSNKPKINGVELTGNKTSANLGLAPATHSHTKDEITGLTIPTNTSDLTNDSDFISSTVVTAFWSGTQAEYDAITSKNATTLYLITEE